jgi:hypothetical protein
VRAALLLLVLALLQGCSPTKLAYNNADVFLRWQANHYLDLEDEQDEAFDRGLNAVLAWHRAKALPQYARLAEQAAARLEKGGLKREDLEWGYDAVRAQAREALGVAAGEAAGILDRLDPVQISHLERRLAEDNRKFAKERMQGSMEERQQRSVKRNVERLEEWFGPLNDTQVARVRRYSERVPYAAELQDRDRKRRQAEFIAMLKAREAHKRLATFAQDWDAGRTPAYAEAALATRNEYMDLLVDLDKTLSADQRRHAVARIRRYGSLFDTLVRQP